MSLVKMRTAELIGPALDWAVAQIESETEHVQFSALPSSQHYYALSRKWAQGGPLIEKHEINTIRCNDLYFPKGNEHGDFYEPYWKATLDGGTDAGIPLYKTYGHTPLIAAMRCLCCAKLGDTVHIPEELCLKPSS